MLDEWSCTSWQGAVGTGQRVVSNVGEERLSSTSKAVDQGGCCDHLEPNQSKGKAEFKVGLGIKSMAVKADLRLHKTQKNF